jgi:hypothetical protein
MILHLGFPWSKKKRAKSNKLRKEALLYFM